MTRKLKIIPTVVVPSQSFPKIKQDYVLDDIFANWKKCNGVFIIIALGSVTSKSVIKKYVTQDDKGACDSL